VVRCALKVNGLCENFRETGEKIMLNKSGMRLVIILAAISIVAIGCTKKGESEVASGKNAKSASKPFEAVEIGGGGGGPRSIALSAADEKLIVPGSNFGKAPPVKKNVAKKKHKKRRKGKKKGKSFSPKYAPYSEGIAEQMEGLKWGMTYKKVLSMFEHKIRESYQDDIKASTGDALAEDKIRTKMIHAITKMRKSYIKFDGQRSGYESHLISTEFTHNNNESMMVWDAGKYVEYLFFFNERFWKRIRSFRVDSFSSKLTFTDFLGSIENHFGGPGKKIYDKKGKLDKMAWRDEETFAYVMDRSAFFGIFALKFTAAITETYLSKLRTNKDRAKGKVSSEISSMVDSVTSSQGDLSDNQSSVIDGYTGEGYGSPNDAKMNSADSVTSQYNSKKKKKKAEKDNAKKDKNSVGTSNDIDDLF